MSPTRTASDALTIETLRAGCNSATTIDYPPRAILFPQGVLTDSLFFIDLGIVKLTHVDSCGKGIIVGVRRQGCLMGMTAAILRQPQPAAAVTLTNCRLLRISASELLGLMNAESSFGRYLHELHAQEVHDHLLNAVELASHSAEYRLAKLLSELVFGEGTPLKAAAARNVQIPFKQWEIAEFLGVTPEHTSRVFRRLEQDGLVLRRGRFLVIPEPQKLFSFLRAA
jgi:CRP-like cAMP-binding protein